MRKRALITGISGQDGSYLSELLLSQGYDVWGLLRSATRQGSLPTSTFAQIHKLTGEIESYEQVSAAIAEAKPDECYHLAAKPSLEPTPGRTKRRPSTPTSRVLGTFFSALREHTPNCRMFFAGSSEMFGDADITPRRIEDTPFRPKSIYGVSKVAAYHLMRFYRETHGLHASCGILYNHESPRRGEHFVNAR